MPTPTLIGTARLIREKRVQNFIDGLSLGQLYDLMQSAVDDVRSRKQAKPVPKSIAPRKQEQPRRKLVPIGIESLADVGGRVDLASEPDDSQELDLRPKPVIRVAGQDEDEDNSELEPDEFQLAAEEPDADEDEDEDEQETHVEGEHNI